MKTPSVAVGSIVQNLAERIRRARRLSGISQAELARRVRISPSAVAQWEQAKATIPSLSHLIEISKVASVSLEWLLTGEGKPRRTRKTEADAALAFELYAFDSYEEALLKAYRMLTPRVRKNILELVEEIAAKPSRNR